MIMRNDEYASYDALGLKALLDAGEVSAKELHDTAVAAIESLNPQLNFLVESTAQEAERALANLNPQAPFAGVPFLLKDGVGMTGLSAAWGSRLAAGLQSKKDSELVKRLKHSGVVIVGTTNIPEFANAYTTESIMYGPARNPWNLNYSTGGSSGGASCAVAAGVVPMAQSSDGAGSIRVPAHCCGVFGLMPSRGRNPCGPDDYGTNFGILRQHVTTRSVRDSAAMLDCLQGQELGALFRTGSPKRPFIEEVGADPGCLRIAFSITSPSGEPVHPDCVAAVEKAVQLCCDLGHHVEEAEPAYNWEQFLEAFTTHWAFNSLYIESIARETVRKIDLDTVEHSTLLMLQRGKSLTTEKLYEMFSQLHGINHSVEKFFVDWDILITPVCLTPAPPLGKINSNSADVTSVGQWSNLAFSKFSPFAPVFNSNGQPSVSVPLCQSTDNLPVGIQCTARFEDEATLIRLASQLEQACPWKNRKPGIDFPVAD